MKWEYLIFNLIIISGPLALSFERGVHYVSRWKYAISAIFIILIPFIIWDALVTGRHWWFNEAYILDFRLAGLPPGEWLFFITVPFAVLFIWEIFSRKTGNPVSSKLFILNKLLLILIPAGFSVLLTGREYTGLTLISLGITGLIDILLKTEIMARRNTYIYLLIIFVLNMVFNGYLTARPVVLYNESYQMGIRLGTVPVEDVFYGFSLLLLNTILFERFKRHTDGS